MPLAHTAHATLPAPHAEVWSALTQPERRAAWWATAPAQRLVAPDARCAFAWEVLGVPSRVEIALAEEASAGCGRPAVRVEVAHTLERELGVARAGEWLDDFWRLALGNLAAHLRLGVDVALPRLDAASGAARPIRLALAIEAPPRAVWSALTEPARLERWIASKAALEPRAGGAISYGWTYQVAGRDVHGGPRRILDWQPERALAFDWPDWRGDPNVREQRVTWTLDAKPGGTRVELVHDGFEREVD
jgi:uncharacterized protein YndB with AHSA1/START domain